MRCKGLRVGRFVSWEFGRSLFIYASKLLRRRKKNGDERLRRRREERDCKRRREWHAYFEHAANEIPSVLFVGCHGDVSHWRPDEPPRASSSVRWIFIVGKLEPPRVCTLASCPWKSTRYFIGIVNTSFFLPYGPNVNTLRSFPAWFTDLY